MKILLINTYDRGGAANACIRLHKALLNQGIDSKLLVLNKSKNIEECFQFDAIANGNEPQRFNLLQRLFKKAVNKIFPKLLKPKVTKEELFLKNRTSGLELFSFPFTAHDITTSKLYKEADIINLHWVAGFLDYETFFKMNTKPVVWTLHDMNPFTGGEHYLEKIHGINKLGKPITREYSDIEETISRENLQFKINTLDNFEPLTVVAPSKWLRNEASSSKLFEHRKIYHIPYGLDAVLFKNRDFTFSRELYGIAPYKKVILFVADSVTNSRKGYVYLERALEKLQHKDILLCSIGKGSPELLSNIESVHLGSINDERILSLVYSLADVFVIPSLMDNLPNTVLESLMCGTPVIGFPIGGIPDMIEHGENGLLTDELSVDSLRNTIEGFIDQGVALSREEIRSHAILKYDQTIQAQKYVELFKNILN